MVLSVLIPRLITRLLVVALVVLVMYYSPMLQEKMRIAIFVEVANTAERELQ